MKIRIHKTGARLTVFFLSLLLCVSLAAPVYAGETAENQEVPENISESVEAVIPENNADTETETIADSSEYETAEPDSEVSESETDSESEEAEELPSAEDTDTEDAGDTPSDQTPVSESTGETPTDETPVSVSTGETLSDETPASENAGKTPSDESISTESAGEDSSNDSEEPEIISLDTADVEISGLDEYVYTGKAQEPEFTVLLKTAEKDLTLIKDQDYTVIFKNNTDAGMATVLITGNEENNYTGTIEKSFVITPAEITDAVLKHASLSYTGKNRTQSGTTKVYSGEKLLTSKTDYKITYTNNRNAGTAVMTITGKGNYTGTITKNFKIARAKITKASLHYSALDYTGKARTQTNTTVVYSGKTVLKKGTDYKISYSNNVKVGIAVMTITGRGNYTGTLRKTFKIRPKAAKISKLSAAGTGRVKVTWQTVSTQADGYQIQYCPSADFSAKKTKLVKGRTTGSCVLSNITAGKPCYVRIRSYKTVSGTRIYSSLSEVKTITLQVNTLRVVPSGYGRLIYLDNPSADVTSLRAAIWTTQNGQDDLHWLTMEKQNSGSYVAGFSIADLGFHGRCIIHCYCGRSFVKGSEIQIAAADWFKAKYLYGSDSNIDFIQCALNIAANNAIGYGHTWPNTISCAGLVGLALTYCGYGDFIRNDPLGWGYIDLGWEYENVLTNEVGCTRIPGSFGNWNCWSLMPGDLLYYYHNINDNHIAIYVGDGYSVEARQDLDYANSDSSGIEVALYYLPTDPHVYDAVFRIPQNILHYR